MDEARGEARKEMLAATATAKSLQETLQRLNSELANPGLDKVAKDAKQKERDKRATELHAAEREMDDTKTWRERQSQELAVQLHNSLVSDINKLLAQFVEGEQPDLLLDSGDLGRNNIPILVHLDGVPDWTASVLQSFDSMPADAGRGQPRHANGTVSTVGLRFASIDLPRIFNSIPAVKKADEDVTKAGTERGASNSERNKDLQNKSDKAHQEVIDRVQKILVRPVAGFGYQVVLDDSANSSLNGVPVILLHSNAPDLTATIIKALGASSP